MKKGMFKVEISAVAYRGAGAAVAHQGQDDQQEGEHAEDWVAADHGCTSAPAKAARASLRKASCW